MLETQEKLKPLGENSCQDFDPAKLRHLEKMGNGLTRKLTIQEIQRATT